MCPSNWKSIISTWGDNTSEQAQIQTRLMELAVELITAHGLASFDGQQAQIECAYTGKLRSLDVEAVVTVTMRAPNDELYNKLQTYFETHEGYQPKSLARIGDCEAPSIIAGAVYSGHRYAQELEADVDLDNPMKYDRVFFEDD